MANADGTNILLKLAGQTVSGLVDQSMETIIDLIQITSKDSTRKKEYLAGEEDTDLSMSGVLDESDTYTFEYIRAAAVAKAAVAFIFGGTTPGDHTYSGNCIISRVSQSAPKNGQRLWSASMKVTGGVTKGSVTTTA